MSTCPGALLTILIAAMVSAYAWKRFEVMRNYDDTVFQDTVENLADPDESFDYEDTNFNIAIGINSLWNNDLRKDYADYINIIVTYY